MTHQVMDVNEEARLIPEESPCVRDNSPQVNQGALSEHAEGLKKEGTPFAKDATRFAEVTQSVPSRPGDRSYGHEDTSLMQDNVAMSKEGIPLVGKGKPFEEEEGKVMEKPSETLREEVNLTAFTKKEKQTHGEDKLSTQNDKTSSLEDEHSQLIKKEPFLENDRESSTNGETPFKVERGETFGNRPRMTQDNRVTHAGLNAENKPTAIGNRKSQENERLLDGGTIALLKEEEESSDAPVLDDNAPLAKDGLKLLTKDVDSKPFVGQGKPHHTTPQHNTTHHNTTQHNTTL